MRKNYRLKLYLDIDGVLLTTKNTKAKYFSKPFIKFITQRFDCYWLTTHCKVDASTAIKYLSGYFPLVYLNMLQKIKPTNRDTLKTEAIDFESVYVWIDDMPMESEMRIMKEKNRGYLIVINENDSLILVKEKLKKILKMNKTVLM